MTQEELQTAVAELAESLRWAMRNLAGPPRSGLSGWCPTDLEAWHHDWSAARRVADRYCGPGDGVGPAALVYTEPVAVVLPATIFPKKTAVARRRKAR